VPMIAARLGPDDGLLMPDRNIRKTWDAVRHSAGVRCTRQHLRQTFASRIAQVGSPAASTLLAHSDVRVTEQWYLSPEVMRWRVNQLPVKLWLGES